MQHAGNRLLGVLYRLSADAGVDPKFVDICRNWHRITGSLLAQRAFVVKLDHSTLFVGVANHIWMQELVLQRHSLLEQLNRLTGAGLTDLRFVLRPDKDEKRF